MASGGVLPAAEIIMKEVQNTTGLDDYGDWNPASNLTRFLESVERQARPSEAGATALLGNVRRRLTNRLEVEQWYRTHPALERANISQILSITGLPRTGTTALVNLMSLDDQFRPLRGWEQSKSTPPPVLGEEANDPRRLQALEAQQRMARERPDLAAMHLYDIDATEEDVELLGASFQAQQLALPIFDYHAWWRNADLSKAFLYHRRVLRLLQSRRPPHRWLLKAPSHCFHLNALFGAYPDTKVIMTHRDPAKVIPSTASLLAAMYPPHCAIDPVTIGREVAAHERVGIERAMAARRQIGEDRFFDVHHHDLVKKPLETLERIYDFLGMEFRPQMRARVEAWLARNSSGAHGVHRYTAEQFGLNATQLHADFAGYMQRFDVAAEQ